jgi:hypothetical protein
MELNYLRPRTLSAEAAELIQFDVASLKQVVAGRRGDTPDTWIVDPDQYEKDGRVLRDSPTYRLVAYSSKDHVLYASDGCNACSREMTDFRNVSDIPSDLLDRLASLANG